jgi:hypothetical protein
MCASTLPKSTALKADARTRDSECLDHRIVVAEIAAS